MPIPSPKKKQSKEQFVSSCMSDPVMLKEYSDPKQRAAICYSQLEKRSKASDALSWEDASAEKVLILL